MMEVTHQQFRNTITNLELKGNELSNNKFEVEALPLTNIMHQYSREYESMAVENQQLKDEVNLLRGNKAKLAKMSYAQGYNAAIKDIEKGSVISPIGVNE
jgi:cell division protein FtsB